MISTSISIAGTNTVAFLQSCFRTFLTKNLIIFDYFRSKRLNTTAATSPFEQKNRETTRSNDLELETIEMVGIFSVYMVL